MKKNLRERMEKNLFEMMVLAVVLIIVVLGPSPGIRGFSDGIGITDFNSSMKALLMFAITIFSVIIFTSIGFSVNDSLLNFFGIDTVKEKVEGAAPMILGGCMAIAFSILSKNYPLGIIFSVIAISISYSYVLRMKSGKSFLGFG